MLVDERTARRMLIAAVLAGLALRLAFGLVYWTGKPLTHDEHEYLSLARSLTAGQGFVYDAALESGTGAQFGRAPGYPAFLAAIGAGRTVVATAPVRVKVVQAILGSAVVWLLGVWTRRLWGPTAGAAAAAIAACYPPLVWMSAYVLSESLYSLLALAAAYTLNRAAGGQDHGWRRAAVAGALTGVAMLVRPDLIVFVPLALLWLGLRSRYTIATALLLACVVVVAPWTMRNARVHGRLILVAATGGVNFWIGNHPLATGDGDLAANPGIKQADLELRAAHPGLGAEALEPIYYRESFRYIASHPGWWLSLVARKSFYVAVPVGASYAVHSFRYRVAAVASYLLLLPFTLLGLWRTRHSAKPTALFLLAGSAVVVCLMFFPQERYRAPVIDPALIVCAAGAVVRPRR
jgi:4-amino-4-deoxy-L-arabinose transferase-like glycosyltransferase